MNLRKNKSLDKVQDKIDNIIYLADNKFTQEIQIKHEKLEEGYELDCQHQLIEKNIAKILAEIKMKENDYMKLNDELSRHITDITDYDSKIEAKLKELKDSKDLREPGQLKINTNLNSAQFMKDTASLYKSYMMKNEEENLAFERGRSYELSKTLDQLKLKLIKVKVSYIT